MSKNGHKHVRHILVNISGASSQKKFGICHICHNFFRLLAPRGRKSLSEEESGMKYNILSAQMWPSWVFGSSGFPSDRLPQLTLPSQKGNQWAPIGWGLTGLIRDLRMHAALQATTPTSSAATTFTFTNSVRQTWCTVYADGGLSSIVLCALLVDYWLIILLIHEIDYWVIIC